MANLKKHSNLYIYFKPIRLPVVYRKYTKSVGASKNMMTRIQNLNDELQTVSESDRKTWSSFLLTFNIFFKLCLCAVLLIASCWCLSGSGSHFPLWCRSRSGFFPKFYTWWKILLDYFCTHNCPWLLHWFIFVVRCHCFQILESMLKFSGKTIV